MSDCLKKIFLKKIPRILCVLVFNITFVLLRVQGFDTSPVSTGDLFFYIPTVFQLFMVKKMTGQSRPSFKSLSESTGYIISMALANSVQTNGNTSQNQGRVEGRYNRTMITINQKKNKAQCFLVFTCACCSIPAFLKFRGQI